MREQLDAQRQRRLLRVPRVMHHGRQLVRRRRRRGREMQRGRVDLPGARIRAGGSVGWVGADRLGIVCAQAVAKAGLVARLELGAVDGVCGAREQADDDGGDGGDAERGARGTASHCARRCRFVLESGGKTGQLAIRNV